MKVPSEIFPLDLIQSLTAKYEFIKYYLNSIVNAVWLTRLLYIRKQPTITNAHASQYWIIEQETLHFNFN